MNNKTEKIIGIDLGTTNSCIAYSDGSATRVIENLIGKRTTPSVVCYTAKDNYIVGQDAVDSILIYPTSTISAAKRIIGVQYKDLKERDQLPFKVIDDGNGGCAIEVLGEYKSAIEISSHVLAHLKTCAEKYFGEAVKKCVITVPAYFNDSQRNATAEAARAAGLICERLINEPTAACIAFGQDNASASGNIAVFDLGGGTFDVSIVNKDKEFGTYEVLGTDGINNFGGEDIDRLLVTHVIKEFKKIHGVDLKDQKAAFYRIKEACRLAKEQLSHLEQTKIKIQFLVTEPQPIHLDMGITRALLENLTRDQLERTKQCCERALKAANINIEDLNHVICVGGMTRMPLVQQFVEQVFGKKPILSINPDEIVAVGAAIQGSIIRGDYKQDILLLDVTSLSLGIETVGGVSTVIIPKNSAIPTKKSQVFSTAEDNQTAVTIKVLQGERALSADNHQLGLFELLGIPPKPRGIPQIEVTFDIDSNGIVNVSAHDKTGSARHEIVVNSSSGLTKEQILAMQQNAEKYAEADKLKREQIELKNRIEYALYDYDHLKNQDSISKLKEIAEKLRAEKDSEGLSSNTELVDMLTQFQLDVQNAKRHEESPEKASPEHDGSDSSSSNEPEPEVHA
jgi:molecular chaperone DnaK